MGLAVGQNHLFPLCAENKVTVNNTGWFGLVWLRPTGRGSLGWAHTSGSFIFLRISYTTPHPFAHFAALNTPCRRLAGPPCVLATLLFVVFGSGGIVTCLRASGYHPI